MSRFRINGASNAIGCVFNPPASLGSAADWAMASALLVSPLLTFEGLANAAAIGNWYNGGGGTNYGVSFTANAIALQAPPGLFENQPAPGNTVMTWISGANTTANLTVGFSTQISFHYSGTSALTVDLYDGGGGNIGTSGALAGVGGGGCTPGITLCNWNTCIIPFAGVCMEIIFRGAAGLIIVDNVMLGP